MIEARGVRKVYASRRGSVTALDGIDLRVRPGEFVSIVGPSGCGKSTLLYIVGGFVAAGEGDVLVDGEPVTAPDPSRGIVFQEFALFGWKTVLGNVAFGLPRGERGRARAMLELVGLSEFAGHYPKELSGGMKQRVALARALVMEPEILLMDEPFAAVDAQTRAALQRELLALWEQLGMTVLFVTHSVEEALLLSDRVVVLSGRPARVLEELVIDLPRPRELGAIVELHRHVWSLL